MDKLYYLLMRSTLWLVQVCILLRLHLNFVYIYYHASVSVFREIIINCNSRILNVLFVLEHMRFSICSSGCFFFFGHRNASITVHNKIETSDNSQ